MLQRTWSSIQKKYEEMGGARGPLGQKTHAFTGETGVCVQQYQYGRILAADEIEPQVEIQAYIEELNIFLTGFTPLGLSGDSAFYPATQTNFLLGVNTTGGAYRTERTTIHPDESLDAFHALKPPLQISLPNQEIFGDPILPEDGMRVFIQGYDRENVSEDDLLGRVSLHYTPEKIFRLKYHTQERRFVTYIQAGDAHYSVNGEVHGNIVLPPTIDIITTNEPESGDLPTTARIFCDVPENGDTNPTRAVSFKWQAIPNTPRIMGAGGRGDVSITFFEKGVYDIRVTVANSRFETSQVLRYVINTYPSVNVEWNLEYTGELPLEASLSGEVVDTGLVDSQSPVAHQWALVSGPDGGARIAKPDQLTTPVTFYKIGVYTFTLTVNNGHFETVKTVERTVHTHPKITAGLDQSLPDQPGVAFLSGRIIETGRAKGAYLRTRWRQVGGPGTASFGDETNPETEVAFTRGGTYVLELSADNGYLAASDTVTIIRNNPPVVDAGPDQEIYLPARAALYGSVSDDGYPTRPGVLHALWTQVSGPAPVEFITPDTLRSAVVFPQPGTYVLRLSATDGDAANKDAAVFTVHAAEPEPAPLVEVPAPQGALVLLQTHYGEGDLWAVIERQDEMGNWVEVSGWRTSFEPADADRPGVRVRHFPIEGQDIRSGTTQSAHRAHVLGGPSGPIMGTSHPFPGPAREGQVIVVEV